MFELLLSTSYCSALLVGLVLSMGELLAAVYQNNCNERELCLSVLGAIV